MFKYLLDEEISEHLDKMIPHYLESLQSNGMWPDIKYASTQRTNWPGADHLERIATLAKGFVNSSNKYFGNENVYASITIALQYWYDKDYRSDNWWFNEIAIPQALGEILIMMKEGPKPLPLMLENNLLLRMNRGQMWKQTGANKLDVAMHNIYRASVMENENLMDSAVSEAFEPITFTTKEGIQYDYSNMQHGRQMMIGSYGFVFVNGEYKIASFLYGTKYAITADKFKAAVHLFL